MNEIPAAIEWYPKPLNLYRLPPPSRFTRVRNSELSTFRWRKKLRLILVERNIIALNLDLGAAVLDANIF